MPGPRRSSLSEPFSNTFVYFIQMIRTETITRQADLFAKNIFVDVILNYIETTLKKARKIKKNSKIIGVVVR